MPVIAGSTMYFVILILSPHKDTYFVVMEVSQNACILHSKTKNQIINFKIALAHLSGDHY